jgi:hypothetical protein
VALASERAFDLSAKIKQTVQSNRSEFCSMVQSKPAKSVKLADLREWFGLQRVDSDDFFDDEWLGDLPALTAGERDRLDQVRRHYLYLLEYPVMEGVVKWSSCHHY